MSFSSQTSHLDPHLWQFEIGPQVSRLADVTENADISTVAKQIHLKKVDSYDKKAGFIPYVDTRDSAR